MISVFLNGVLQVPGFDYRTGEGTIMFTTPPPAGSHVTIKVAAPTEKTTILKTDGRTYLFPLVSDFARYTALKALLDDAARYHDHPAVADVFERLQVVMALVKENGRS